MGNRYNFWCKRCGSELLFSDAHHYEIVRAVRCAPAIGKCAIGLLLLGVELRIDSLTFGRREVEWFAQHGDHELAPSRGGVPYGTCWKECALPDDHPGPCVAVEH